MNDTEDTVPRDKYREVLDQRNQFKNYWYNASEKKEWLEENTVPKSDLEELVERWRDRVNRQDELVESGRLPKTNLLEECADELEQVLEE